MKHNNVPVLSFAALLCQLYVTFTLAQKTLTHDPCDKEDANGCTAPHNMEFPFKDVFTPSCNRHDICYSCAKAHGVTRERCDTAFFHDMIQTCKSLNHEAYHAHVTGANRRSLEKRGGNLCSRITNFFTNREFPSPGLDCGDFKLMECVGMADLAHDMVKTFGSMSFAKSPAEYCDKEFVSRCLPKTGLLYEKDGDKFGGGKSEL